MSGENVFNTRRLPGTDGDYIDEDDVEGHRATVRNPAIPEEGEGIARARNPLADEDDVEGHRATVRNPAIPEEGEGLYRLPTTQGEIARRGPGDNPHGE
jgi:hypothetical protein